MLTTAALYLAELLHQLLLIPEGRILEDELCFDGVLLGVGGQRLLGVQVPSGQGNNDLTTEEQTFTLVLLMAFIEPFVLCHSLFMKMCVHYKKIKTRYSPCLGYKQTVWTELFDIFGRPTATTT